MKPTVAELEAILDEPDDKYTVQIQPDGSVLAVENPKVQDLEDVLREAHTLDDV